jgi:hypothetical protein
MSAAVVGTTTRRSLHHLYRHDPGQAGQGTYSKSRSPKQIAHEPCLVGSGSTFGLSRRTVGTGPDRTRRKPQRMAAWRAVESDGKWQMM